MSRLELGSQPITLPRGRVTVVAELAGVDLSLRAVTEDTDEQDRLTGLFSRHGVAWVGMLNRPVLELPSRLVLVATSADGRPFPAEGAIQLTLTIEGPAPDTVTWRRDDIGGLSEAPVLTIAPADRTLTLTKEWGEEHDSRSPRAAGAAAAARIVLGGETVPGPEQAHVVVAVDGSGSMKAPLARAQLTDVLDCLTGVHAVLGSKSKRLVWKLVLDRVVELETSESLVQALDEAPYGLPRSLDLPDLAETDGDLAVVYLVTDDVPTGIADFADVDLQARHLVLVGCPGGVEEAIGPIEVTRWPDSPPRDGSLPRVMRSLLRGCFDESTPCGQAVAR